LASKWAKTGLLEGLATETDKNNMSLMLENQAKQLINESSLSGGGTAGASFTPGVGEQWAGVALPLVRKVFGQISAKEFVSVQPMNLPSGLVFFLDFQYGTTKAPFSANDSLYGNTGSSADLPFGNSNTGGLYGAGKFGYSINNITSSCGGRYATRSFMSLAHVMVHRVHGSQWAALAPRGHSSRSCTRLRRVDALWPSRRHYGVHTGRAQGDLFCLNTDPGHLWVRPSERLQQQ
jgi:hypothetical protein